MTPAGSIRNEPRPPLPSGSGGASKARIARSTYTARMTGSSPLERSSTQRDRTTRLGKAGPAISRLGFGAWAIGGPYQHGWGPVDDNDSVAAIGRAVASGINWIDTAPAYGLGHSEDVVGIALRKLAPDDRPLIFTKCGRTWDLDGTVTSDLRPASIRQQCDESLARLGVDAIDLYQIHRPDDVTGTPVEDSWSALADLIDAGKVRWIGVSNFSEDLLERCHRIRPIDSVQRRFNFLDRGAAQVVDWCRERQVGFLAYSPLASGLLSDGFTRERLAQMAEGDWRKRSPRFTEPALTINLEVAACLSSSAASLGQPLSSLAVAWTLSQPGVTAAIVGARRPAQVAGWADAWQLALSSAQMAGFESCRDSSQCAS